MFILRSSARATIDPIYAQYEPLSVSASGDAPDLSVAPVELWEEVASLEGIPPFAPIYVAPPAPPEPEPPNPAVLVKGRILEAMEFGKQLTAEFGASNVLAGKTTAQIAAISDKLSVVQARILSGSLYAALEAIDALQPDANVSAEAIAEFKLKVQVFLGIEDDHEEGIEEEAP
jgi:hypothetical protein